MTKLFEIRGLELSYGNKKSAATVGPLDLDIFENESLGIIGESGAGKSTLGLELLGLLEFKGGRQLAGNVRTNLKSEQMSYIPQDPVSSLDPLFSIGSQLGEITKSSKEMEEALARVHLSLEKMSLKSYPHELSGGMRQRLLIAMALLRRPRLVVADEPTSSLDVTLQSEVMNLFREIKRSGVSFLFITHNLPLAASFCSRLVIMQLGRIVEFGFTEEIIKNPKNVYTQKLLKSIPRLNR